MEIGQRVVLKKFVRYFPRNPQSRFGTVIAIVKQGHWLVIRVKQDGIKAPRTFSPIFWEKVEDNLLAALQDHPSRVVRDLLTSLKSNPRDSVCRAAIHDCLIENNDLASAEMIRLGWSGN